MRRANELDGRTWGRYSVSVWSDIRRTAEETRLGHPAMFPLELALRLIYCFTNRDDRVVLDPFAGVGSTPIAAQLAGKVGVGIELSPAFGDRARQRQIAVPMAFDEHGQPVGRRLGGVLLPVQEGERHVYTDDARRLLRYVTPASVDLVLTSPPYWDILLRARSADQKDIRHYGDAEADLGKIGDYRAFIAALKEVFRPVYEALRPGKYCVVVVMDIRKKDRFYPYHADLAAMMQELGFVFDDTIIWDRRQEYNNLRPLGYPARFRINKVHEFIQIFLKPEAAEA